MAYVVAGSGNGSAYLSKVYAWMFFGMLVSAVSAFTVLSSATLVNLLATNTIVYYGLLLLELVLVLALGGLAARLPPAISAILFIVYSSITGVTLSLVLLYYSTVSVFAIFLVTAGIFAAMSVYGFVTKRDLSGIGMILFMLLIGICLAGIVNLFLNNSLVYLITSVIGVFVFTGLTAYDVQRIKRIGESMGPDADKYAIAGALSLYLDFINLFIELLNLFGKRRRD